MSFLTSQDKGMVMVLFTIICILTQISTQSKSNLIQGIQQDSNVYDNVNVTLLPTAVTQEMKIQGIPKYLI